jgi:hypothetical protein
MEMERNDMTSTTNQIRTFNPDALPARMLLRNGALLILPPMLITFGLWAALPAAYNLSNFWRGIPAWLGLLENIFRLLVCALPGILYFGKKETGQAVGWVLYAAGLFIYLASYLFQIYLPTSVWSLSLLGFTAPAWTTVFWLAGIGLVCVRSWLPVPWHRLIFLGCAFCFLLCHVGHTTLVFFQAVH